MSVPQGTTPTFTLVFPSSAGIDFTAAQSVYVTFSSGKINLTKTGESLVLTVNTIEVLLSQSETLMFEPGEVDIQANWVTPEGKRLASEIVSYKITKQLLKKVVE